MAEKRKVLVRHYIKMEDGKLSIADKGYGTFCAFGVDYEEFESGPGNYSTAIVEYPDGTVENVPVNLIRFVDVD